MEVDTDEGRPARVEQTMVTPWEVSFHDSGYGIDANEGGADSGGVGGEGWDKRLVQSEWKKDENMAGEWNYTSGKWNGDATDKGLTFRKKRLKFGD